MIRLGITESFEEQPCAVTSTIRELCKGWWQADYQITAQEARSGNRSMLIQGITVEKLQEPLTNFNIAPQIPLDANST